MKYVHVNEIFESPLAEIYTEVFGELETEQFLGSIWSKLKKHGRPIMLGLGLLARDPAGNLKPIDPFAEQRRRDAIVQQNTRSDKPVASGPPGNTNNQEFLTEDEFNLRRYREREKLSNDKNDLRAQARAMIQRAFPEKVPLLKTMNVDHIIPLEFIHLFKSDFNVQSSFMMDGFKHPNSPDNLRLVNKALHQWITSQWSTFKNSLPKDWNANPSNQRRALARLKPVLDKINITANKAGAIQLGKDKLSLTNNEFHLQ